MQKLLTFFQQKISIIIYAIFNDQSFNNTLTNNIVSFEQLGPDVYLKGTLTREVAIVKLFFASLLKGDQL